MRLSANVITHGRYYKVGEDIPDELISDAMRKYAVDLQEQRRDADNGESNVRTPRQRRRAAASYVKRGDGFEPASKVDVMEGETLYWHRKRSFGVSEKFIAFGRVGNEA